ncbi:hypothetical protein [Streptomyces sp. NPDC020747]|uniref:hypothetical protein n=1 Tax=Streptomyces sp. NPDC020747 TaxID=3365086 RepID=UPI0037B22C5C
MPGIFTASRAAEFAVVDPTLATLLGREPIPLSTVQREQLPDDEHRPSDTDGCRPPDNDWRRPARQHAPAPAEAASHP